MDKKNTRSARSDREEGKFTDLFKKTFYTGVGAVFMTEEAIRQTLGEMKLPQEMLKSVLNNASKGKEEVLAIVRQELRNVFEKFDISNEIEKILHKNDIHISINVTPKKK